MNTFLLLPLFTVSLSNIAALERHAPAKASHERATAPGATGTRIATDAAKTEAIGHELSPRDFAVGKAGSRFAASTRITGRLSRTCLVNFEDGEDAPWITGDADGRTQSASREIESWNQTDAIVHFGGERLVFEDHPDTSDTAVHLERSVIDLTKATATFEEKASARISLTLLGKNTEGVEVYAYRTAQHLFVVAPSDDEASSSRFRNASDPQATAGGVESGVSNCGYVTARLVPGDPRGSVAELDGVVNRGTKDKPAKQGFTVHVSVSKTSRDKDPLVSIGIRMMPRATTP